MVKRLFSIFAVLTLFFVAVGCGDDDPQPSSTDDTEAEDTTPETTEAGEEIALDDWVDDADEICGDTDEAMSELVEPADDDDVDGAIAYLEDLLDIQQGQLDDLTELGVPDDEADTVEEALGLLNDQIELVETAIDDLEDGDDLAEVVATVMEEGEDLGDDLTDLAEALGLEVCGSDSGSDDPPTTGSSGEPFTYGDDPALDEMWDDCEDGRPEACDDLFRESPVDSEYEEFGRTCGGRLEGVEAQTTYCVDAM